MYVCMYVRLCMYVCICVRVHALTHPLTEDRAENVRWALPQVKLVCVRVCVTVCVGDRACVIVFVCVCWGRGLRRVGTLHAACTHQHSAPPLGHASPY